MKKFFVLLALLSLLTVLVSACLDIVPSSSNTTNSTPTVHMNETNFVTNTIMINKGQTLNLVDDASVVHIIQNGSWDQNGSPRPVTETGAPHVDQQFNGNDTHTIGPFTTAGTFHFYCTIHTGMNLTVTVK
ncbi:MAG TPA: plastocyanin/azurin family copper-binding protein [Ktedonobacteraceae bacterium]|jgi:plastocyanin